MGQHWLLSSAVKDLNLIDIAEMSESEAFELFCETRWGSKTEQCCSRCGVIDNHYFRKNRKQWKCKHCDLCFSVTTKTVWADRKLPFKKILLMIFLFTSSPNAISASSLSRKIGVSYKTAWVFCHKLREAIIRTEDDSLMTGEVHVDGGHFGGKPRSGQYRNIAKPEDIAAKIKLGKSQGAKRSRMSRANYERKKRNRRIPIVVRQVQPGFGGVRTRIFISKAEDHKVANFIKEHYIEKGASVRTDECPAYNLFSGYFDHETVEHSKEYSTVDGINNNQAESFFSRPRRSEYGVFHRMMARYMLDYMNEMAWREDGRRETESERFLGILRKSLFVKNSLWWRGYWQGVKRNDEMIAV
ncbi:IS1595 family transposase [Pseudoalteromonas sp. Isolate3]|uniref:IS1595 family transposase n=1 Tax=Pseudoalteromonas sp. Isolate3 TaxID=2908526 RepID=UPI001EFEA103|nr:IS1595 family transposase [Pseudoalteromonas sp. Isolate3]MCG9708717.1 IS1595 family transposase [Pseudoalteromonas sp. Isolate3]